MTPDSMAFFYAITGLTTFVHLACGVALVLTAASLRRRVDGPGWKWLLASGLGFTSQVVASPVGTVLATWVGGPEGVLFYTSVLNLVLTVTYVLWWGLLLRGIVLVAGARPAG